MSKIAVKQLNESELTSFVALASSGDAFAQNMAAFAAASGTFGGNVVYTTGTSDITGVKTFRDSPIVPYLGGTGTAPSTRYVNDQDLALSGVLTGQFPTSASIAITSGILSTGITSLSGYVDGVSGVLQTAITANGTSITSLSGYVNGASGALSAVRVTGSATIPIAHFTGLGGTLIIHSGDYILVSGAAGGGSSNTSVTGSAAISAPNFTGVGTVTLTYDGTYVKVSGAAGADATLSGYVENSFVHRYGDESVTGVKTFVSSPLVPNATTTGQAINLGQLSGTSGVLASLAGGTTNNYYITGTGVVTALSSGTVTNTFNITSGTTNVNNAQTSTNTITASGTTTVINSGTATNTFNGAVNSYTNINQPTGNFVNISFWYDQYNLATGLNSIETSIGRSFTFTGYSLGAINSGTQGFFSGSFYQRTPTNTKTTFVDISLNSGLFFTANGGYNQEISGMNRLGIDIYSIGTGITGLSVGIFGVGY